jgi:hypothetical protein
MIFENVEICAVDDVANALVCNYNPYFMILCVNVHWWDDNFYNISLPVVKMTLLIILASSTSFFCANQQNIFFFLLLFSGFYVYRDLNWERERESKKYISYETLTFVLPRLSALLSFGY